METLLSSCCSFPFFPEATLITTGSEGMNSHSPVLLPDMMTSGNLASVQRFPEHHPSGREVCSVCPFCGRKMSYCYIHGNHKNQYLSSPNTRIPSANTRQSREVRHNPPRFAACREWLWRVQSQDRARRVHAHTHSHKTGQCAHSLKGFPKSLFPHSFFFHE